MMRKENETLKSAQDQQAMEALIPDSSEATNSPKENNSKGKLNFVNQAVEMVVKYVLNPYVFPANALYFLLFSTFSNLSPSLPQSLVYSANPSYWSVPWEASTSSHLMGSTVQTVPLPLAPRPSSSLITTAQVLDPLVQPMPPPRPQQTR